MQDFLGDDPRFAGTGAGEDELDAAGGDGFLLGGGEGHEDKDYFIRLLRLLDLLLAP